MIWKRLQTSSPTFQDSFSVVVVESGAEGMSASLKPLLCCSGFPDPKLLLVVVLLSEQLMTTLMLFKCTTSQVSSNSWTGPYFLQRWLLDPYPIHFTKALGYHCVFLLNVQEFSLSIKEENAEFDKIKSGMNPWLINYRLFFTFTLLRF